MKNLQLVVVCCLLFVSGYGQSVNKIEVIDFHSTHRCITCKAIESNTKLVLETNFSKELKDGIISFHVVNVDDENNYKLAEKFQATGTALFLNVISEGEEKHIDLTQFGFMYGKNTDEFTKRLTSRIEKQLSKI
ncbi:nitrophenyl compound nitroreductase subunit ArsF family protein [Lutibacter sp.]|uniref:nitrophenyl compound nitroreductase subunit ArsF family protein n=1 Tax=Lutibacter sp. TaxID=1925666 RepID=UPI0034A07B40